MDYAKRPKAKLVDRLMAATVVRSYPYNPAASRRLMNAMSETDLSQALQAAKFQVGKRAWWAEERQP